MAILFDLTEGKIEALKKLDSTCLIINLKMYTTMIPLYIKFKVVVSEGKASAYRSVSSYPFPFNDCVGLTAVFRSSFDL